MPLRAFARAGVNTKNAAGIPLKENTGAARTIPTDVLTQLSRQEAAELIRRQQQGLGNPIVALKMNCQQVVAAGNTLYWSANWKTFADFLAG